jgi:predicted dehydrogenase
MGIVEKARQLLVDDGGVGRVEHVSVVMSSIVRDLLVAGRPYIDVPVDTPLRAETWGDPGVSGGGYAQGQLTHAIGLLFRLLPMAAEAVMAMTATPGDSAVELHDALALRLEGGAIGSISGSATPWGTFGNEHQLQIRVTGDRGQLLFDLDRPLVRRSRGEADDLSVALSAEDVTWSFQRVVDRFVDLAAGRTAENRSPADLGARVVEVIEAMYRSAASGQTAAIERE